MSTFPARARSVLHVVQPEDGGVAEHVLQLAVGQRARGWHVELATSAGNRLRGTLPEQGFRMHVVPLVRQPGPRNLSAARALRGLDRADRFDVVHAHSSMAGALVRMSLPDRCRLVYTPHCFPFAARFGTVRQAAYWAAEQALVSRAAAIITLCGWERRTALRWLRGSASRLHLVEHGVPEAPFAPPDPGLVAFADGKPLAGTISVLRPEKDPMGLVRNVAAMVRVGTLPGRVAIVGNGQLRDAVVQEIERLGVDDHVRWFPYGGAVAPYLAALDLFLLPSRWESFPISLLEAMRSGVPVLASAVGGVPEIVQEGVTGGLVAAGDHAAFTGALHDLLGDPERLRRMGRAARGIAHTRYDVDRMVDETIGVYGHVLGEAGAGAAA